MLDWLKGARQGTGEEHDIALSGEGLLITGQNGLIAGTRVVSSLGWREVETLRLGERVLTFDNGMRTVTDIQRETLRIGCGAAHKGILPIHVPQGALHNRRDLWLMPGQGLLIESTEAFEAMGDPFAVVPAGLLDGFRGVCRKAPASTLDVTILSFAEDEVVYVDGGLLAHCPRPCDLMNYDPDGEDGRYTVLNQMEGRWLVRHLIESEEGRGFTYDPEEVLTLI